MNDINMEIRFIYSSKNYFLNSSVNCTLEELIDYLIDIEKINYCNNSYLCCCDDSRIFLNEKKTIKELGIQEFQIILII